MDVRRSDSRVVKPLPPSPHRAATPNRASHARPSTPKDVFETGIIAARRPVASAPFTPPAQGVWSFDKVTGQKSDPVTMYVHGNLSDIEATLAKAGWSKADPQGMGSSLRYIGAAVKEEALKAIHFATEKLHGLEIGLAGVFGIHLPELQPAPEPHVAGVDRMPVSAQTVNGQPFASAWECNNNPLGGRDHVRIFDTGQRDAQGLPVYAVSPILDTGIRFAKDHPESGFMFHTVAPDAAPERDKMLAIFQRFGNVSGLKSVPLEFGGPSALGEKVYDSKAYELTLGSPTGQQVSGRMLVAAR